MTAPDQTNAEVSDERLREIIAGCEGVTPGPWHAGRDEDGVVCLYTTEPLTDEIGQMISDGMNAEHNAKVNAAHVARLDPETIRYLAAAELERRSVTQANDERLREIKPCPFCGGDARMTYSDRGEIWQVRCNNWTGTAGSKSCMGGGAYAYTEAEAIALWNRRSVTSQASEGEVAAYRYRDRANGPEERWTYLTPHSITEGPSTILSMVLSKPADYECEPLYASPSKRVERLETALRAMLQHTGVRDAAAEDKDEEDHLAERLAIQALGDRS